jgi:hypothetical protein
VVESADVDGFLESAWGRLRADGIYLNSIPLMLDYFWKARHRPLGLGKFGGFMRISGRWLRSFAGALPFGNEGARPMAPGIVRDQLRAMVKL